MNEEKSSLFSPGNQNRLPLKIYDSLKLKKRTEMMRRRIFYIYIKYLKIESLNLKLNESFKEIKKKKTTRRRIFCSFFLALL